MKEKAANTALAAASLMLCAAAAWSVSQFGWQRSHRLVLPFAFLALVFVLGALYGRLVGMLGSVLSAVVFAHALYNPVGSFFVTDQAARSVLAWEILVGVSLSFLLLPTGKEIHHHHRKK